MNRLLKSMRHIFWPHKKNQYKPMLIRLEGLAISLAALLLVTGIANYASTGQFNVLSYATNITIGDLLSETNQERVALGLTPFSLDSDLNAAAQNKAQHMIDNDYWAHVSPDGIPPWEFIDEQGYIYLKAGENLAFGYLTSSATVAGWMDSPGHKANILDNEFSEVGFGILNGSNFRGNENTVVVAMYALPYEVPDVAQVAVSNPEDPDLSEDPREILTDASVEIAIAENVVDDPVLNTSAAGKVITNFEALITGQANMALYITMSLLLMVAGVYALRHIAAIKHYLVVGEHVLEGHPLLEAGLLYTIIWLLLTATWGVIL